MARSSVPLARQSQRFTPVHSLLNPGLRRLLAGCQADYIKASADPGSLRLPKAAKEVDSLELLETGLPVMYYDPKSRSFQNRVAPWKKQNRKRMFHINIDPKARVSHHFGCSEVKIDQQLSFFFVLEERALRDPVAVRLYSIEEAGCRNQPKTCEETGGTPPSQLDFRSCSMIFDDFR